jgi:tape measure domain-containing protein
MPEQIGLQAVFETAQFQQGLNQYVNGLNQAKGATSGAASVSSSTGSILSTGLAVAFGNILYQAVGAATQALGNFISSGIQSVAQLQQLEIALQSLSAMQIMQAGVTDNMSDALAQAGPVADVLLERLKELSLISPFEYQDVVNTFRLNMAFGASADSALNMTGAILDMASAMGLSGPYLERIVYNFSQMQIAGQITARDVRDLAMAGVNLSSILQNQLGMSIDQVNAALEDGSISMNDVTNAFIEFSKVNFGGSAERMSLTLNGLKSSFADLSFFASQDLFGPLVEKITVDLQGLFQSARNLLDSGALQGIGQALASAYDAMKNIPAALASIGQSISSTFGGSIQDVINNAFNWGVNLIAQFSEGIITGITNFLVGAMNYLSSLLSYWLAPGSPPRVAPDVDQWGAETMNEYLNGFSDADFSSLDSLQGALQSAFSALGLEDTQGIMAGLSQQFAKALSGDGTLDASFFDQLAAAGGQYGDELVRLAKLSLDLSNATEKVAQAQEDVDAAKKKEAAAHEKSNALVNQYNDLLKGGATQDVLDAKLKEINAQEQIAAKAAQEKKAAEKRLENQQAIVASLQDQVDLVEKLIEELTQLYAVQKTPAVTPGTTPGTDGTGTGAGAGGIGAALTNATAGFQQSLTNILNDAKKQVSDASNEMWSALVSRLTTAFQPITDAWNNSISNSLNVLLANFNLFTNTLSTNWLFFVTKMRQDFEPLVSWWGETWPVMQTVFVTAWDQIKSSFDAAWSALQPAFTQLDTLLKSIGIDGTSLAAIMQTVGSVLSGVVAVGVMLVVGSFQALMVILTGVITGLVTAMQAGQLFFNAVIEGMTILVQGIGQTFEGLFNIVVGIIQGNTEKVKQGFVDLGTGIQNAIIGALEAIAGALIAPLATITGLIVGFIKGIIEFFKGLADELVGHSIIPDMLKDMVEVVTDGFKDLLDTIEDFVASTQEGFQNWIDTLTETITKGLASVQSIISAQYTNLYTYGQTIITKISDGIRAQSAAIANAIKDAVNNALSQISGQTGPFYDLGVSLADNIKQGFSDGASGISNIGAQMMDGLIDGIQSKSSDLSASIRYSLDEALVAAGFYMDDFYHLGINLMQALGDGLDDGTSSILDSVEANMQAIVEKMQAQIPAAEIAATSVLAPSIAASRYSQAYTPASSRQVINNNSSSRSLNIPMGGVTIANNMDLSQFEFFIRRVIRSEMGI